MNTSADALADIRKQARKLHEQLDEAEFKTGAAAKRAYADASAQARALASSLRKQAQEQQSAAAARFATAASSLEAAAASAITTADSEKADLRQHQQETLQRVRGALQNISHGIAVNRGTGMR